MSVSVTRGIVGWALLVAVPVSVLGQAPSAILHAQGGAWVNGYEARDSSAVFAGDLLETKPGFSASLSLEGSTVMLQPESVAKFEENMLVLDHGSVSVGTSRSFKLRVNCLTVVPVTNEWTQYDVTDVSGTILVAARKSDVHVERVLGHRKPSPESATSLEGTIHEGEQHSYGESEVCGTQARPTGGGPALNSKWIVAGGAGGIGILICVLVCGGGGPISPAKP